MSKIIFPVVLMGLIYFSFAQPGNVIWQENWEGGWSDHWVVTSGTWEVGSPTSGPDTAYMGQNCAATLLDGNYEPLVESRLEMIDTFTVPAANEYPRLRFWHWYDIAGSDAGEVQIKVGQGSWERLSEVYNRDGGGVWSSPSIDLRPYAGQAAQIGFNFSSDGNPASVDPGWYIDEISLITGEPQMNNLESWEYGLGDWYITRGTWEIGQPTSGPPGVWQGENCAATVLNGNYAPLANTRLASPYFVIPDTSYKPRIRFEHWYDIGGSDYGELQLRVKGGEWQAMSDKFINSSGGIWFSVFADLTPFIGDTVQICFYFRSDGGSSVKSGWYLDNVEVSFYNLTGIDDQLNQNAFINSFKLYQNYPNPFNPSTTIEYFLPSAEFVTLKVYDILGHEVATIVNERQTAGSYQVNFDAGQLASGVYFYKIYAGSFIGVRKMVVMR